MAELPDTINLADLPQTASVMPSFLGDTINLDEMHREEVKLEAPSLQEAQLGGVGQHAIAGLESLARGATLGTSDWAETKLGLSTPEAIKARKEFYPGTDLIGQTLGTTALMGLTGGLAAPVELAAGARGVGALGSAALGFGAEGALISGGNIVSDAALGDPNLNAQKVLSHLGFGTALGAGLGVFSKALGALPALMRKAAPATETAIAPSEAATDALILDAPVVGVKPTSFEDMAKKVEEAVKYGGETTELTQKVSLLDAASRVEMQHPIHPLQVESLSDQAARDAFKTALEMPGKEGNAARGYETLQKNELVHKLNSAIDLLSPHQKPIADAVKGGERAIEAFTEQYQAEKNALTPLFDELNRVDLENNVNHLPGVIEKLTDAVPGVARMFDTEASGIKIKPYSTAWGIDQSTYTAVKQAVNALEENPASFRELMNIREGMSQNVNVLDQGRAPSQIRALKAAMMDYVQDAVQKVVPDIQVREAFKRYAINEQQRTVIEKAFGASVGHPEFGQISKIKPEMIGDKIFGNTANVRAAKAILEPEKFNEILANWLSELKTKATDNGKFSSNKFNNLLRTNQDALNVAFEDTPQLLQRVKDVTTMMRILPDSASINPSGTAKTIVNALVKGGLDPMKHVGSMLEAGKGYLENKKMLAELNQHLAGKKDQAIQLKSMYGVIKKTTDQIQSAAKSIFEASHGRKAQTAGITALTLLSTQDYNDHVEKIKDFASNPDALMEHLSQQTNHAYQTAPGIMQGLYTTIMNGIQYLYSKIPQAPNQMLLSPEWKPTRSQKTSFNRAFEAVNDPVGILKQVKQGTLTNEAMEAVQTVHPDLLNDMRKSVMDQMNVEKAKALPYAQKASLAKFLGQPLDQSQLPETILSNQRALSGPELSQQTSVKQPQMKSSQMKNVNVASRTATRSRRDDQSE